jgi:hypothetical protein
MGLNWEVKNSEGQACPKGNSQLTSLQRTIKEELTAPHEKRDDLLPELRKRTNPSIQTKGIPGKGNPGDDFRSAVSLRRVR